jgi:predicted Ser/Thr protein kinase
MSARSSASAPNLPPVPSLELERLRREVKTRLFGAQGEPPLAVGRYRILACIGQGGMGIVYAARDERLGRTVALKLLRPELTRALDGLRGSDLAREAQALAKLSHPNVVAVFDVGEHEGQVFVAMEYVEGESLRRWLETPRDLAAILDVYLAAGEGLAAAHRAGLVHRDFKPDNVLVATDGRPRILDFGLARSPGNNLADGQPPSFAADAEATATSVSRYGVLLGTPAYMAPEQHLGERADARSDQFGFCVALYQAVYGQLPFASADLRALSLAIVTGRVTPPPASPAVPERLRGLILRGLAVQPEARFPAMDALLTELRQLRTELDSPAAAAASESSYDTRAIARAFGVAGATGEPSSGRPPLTQAELRAIAEEVGLELEGDWTGPRRALDQAGPDPAGLAPITTPSALDQTHFQTHFGLPATLRVERALARLPNPETQRRIVRELERNLGGTGNVEQFDAGLAWANRESEASIDLLPGGARLSIRRSFAKLARKRRRRGLIVGGILGTIVGGVLLDVAPLLAAIEPLFVFGGAGLGMLFGTRFARALHTRQMHEERAVLEWVGERVAALTEADTSPRMLEPGDAHPGRATQEARR